METLNLQIDRKTNLDGSVELRLYDVMRSSTAGNPDASRPPVGTTGNVWNLIYRDKSRSAWIRY